MKIRKIFNNNVVLTENEAGREIIAVGKGVGFHHKRGDETSEDIIQKIYTLSNPDVMKKFEQLIAIISIEYVQVANEIIELAKRELKCTFNDLIYISLTDHVHMAVHRIRNIFLINNVMLWEICKFYEREFLVGQRAVTLLNAHFQVELPEDEAAFITMHIIDAQMEFNVPIANKIMQMIHEIINIIRMVCRVEFDKNSLPYYRLVTHLKFFVKRVLIKQESKTEIEDDIISMVNSKYYQAANCAEKIAALVEKNYNYHVSADEKLYLTIHISKFMNRKLNPK